MMKYKTMCTRFTQTEETAALEKRFHLQPGGPELKPRYNIAPSQQAAVITRDQDRRLSLMRWGLTPHWAKDAKIGFHTFNARAETAAEKPAFRAAFKRRRCLIPADGFYEWKTRGKAKQPLRFTLADEKSFAFAGLWEAWQGQGEALLTFTIITTKANSLVEPVHNRMPVILRPDWEGVWLDMNIDERDALEPLLKPFDPERMKAYPVSTRVNSVKNEGPDLIEPIPVSGGLFDDQSIGW